MNLSAGSSISLFSASDTAGVYIDTLLQDTYLFVMDIYHQPALVRDEALYRRGVTLVEQVQARLQDMKTSAAFIQDVLQAQCALMDYVVLNTAEWDDNIAWLHSPLQSVYLHTLYAGKNMTERTRQLLHEVAPDMRLLVLHQRAYTLGLGHAEKHEHLQERNHLLASLNALVPEGGLPLSTPLVVQQRSTVRGTLRHSRLAHVVLALLITVGLMVGLHASLQHLLTLALPG
ncbi:DotU family type IV/VI secretion system protein [Pseudescherichia vulneris]|uniref:DotU family type IV/VI secretion system protein n=1 Tax=Pseudescherichia vulneris TaxID=566 RepID=UPI00227D3E02|nr:DotU family type IV/VI secretion system protein [Pseudescherichia vulneris]